MNNTLETEKRKKEVPIPELVHKSLVAHGIITNPRVVKCGTYYSWERHIKRRVRCGYVKECPMCYERTADFKRHQMLKTQEECLNAGGQLFLITGSDASGRYSFSFVVSPASTAFRTFVALTPWGSLGIAETSNPCV